MPFFIFPGNIDDVYRSCKIWCNIQKSLKYLNFSDFINGVPPMWSH